MVNTRLCRIMLMGFLFALINNPVFADDKGYFSSEAKGWYWHDNPKAIDEEEDEDNQMMQDPLVIRDAMREQIERAQALSVIDQTKENMKNYLMLQNATSERAQNYERLWKEVLRENPELDYSLKHPTNNTAKRVELDEIKKKEEVVIRELAKKSGLFFFYRSTCPYCVRFAPIVKDFADSYGISVIPITTDGIALPEFPHSFQDQGQAKKFNVTVEPALFVVNPYTHKAIPLAYGLISQADLKNRILTIAVRQGGA